MRYSIRSLILLGAFCALVALLIGNEIRSSARMRSENSLIVTAIVVCDYLDANQNHWPTDWTVLKPVFEERYSNGGLTFEEIQAEVAIDFEIDGAKLLETCVSGKRNTFAPITSKRDGLECREGNPNLIVLNHVGRMISY